MSLIRFLAVIAFALLPGAALAQSPYSSEPLQTEPLLEPEQWLRESAEAVSWLEENYQRIPVEQWVEVRERLYLLIGLAVQDQYRNTGETVVADNYQIGPQVFDWANRLGVIGADLVANALADSTLSPGMEGLVPEQFTVAYDQPHLLLSAQDETWSARVPYYFMTWQLGRVSIDGSQTDVLVTSTLHDLNSSQEGASQSTIMLLVSDQELNAFTSGWLDRMGLSGSDPTLASFPENATTYRASVGGGIQAEGLFWREGDKSVAVIYSGLDGPFEFNRVHFEDFVRNLSF